MKAGGNGQKSEVEDLAPDTGTEHVKPGRRPGAGGGVPALTSSLHLSLSLSAAFSASLQFMGG